MAVAKCPSCNEDLTAKLTMFDQLGGLERIVRGKTVTVKLNLTGSPAPFPGPAAGHYPLHASETVGATAHLMGKAGAKRIRLSRAHGPPAGRSKSTC